MLHLEIINKKFKNKSLMKYFIFLNDAYSLSGFRDLIFNEHELYYSI